MSHPTMIAVKHKETGRDLVIAEDGFDPDLHVHVDDNGGTAKGKQKDKVVKSDKEKVAKDKAPSDVKKKEIKDSESTEKENIRSAVLSLSPYNNEHWTSSGEPKMLAIEKILGHETTRRVVEEVAGDINRETIGSKQGGDDGNAGL